MASRGLTDLAIRNLRASTVRREIPDHGGLYVIIQPSGRRGFAVRYRFNGVPKKLTLPAGVTLAQARKLAADAVYEVARGHDPSVAKKATQARVADAAANTVEAVCREYLRREGGKLRTGRDRELVLGRLVYPILGNRPVDAVTRIDVTRLLDRIEDDSGPRMADLTLAFLRRIFNWHATRTDRFSSPIIRGMARVNAKEHARSRILNDDELRAVWKAADEGDGPFPALIKFLLLTAARRNEAMRLQWNEISGADWILPAIRNKTKQELVRPLSAAAQAVLAAQPQIVGCSCVFTSNGRTPIGTGAWFKKRFDKACGVTGWTLHDLRRTARSLMSRAGVNADHAERALGHVIGGIRQTYDRYEFYPEKRHAFEALAALIQRIVDPQSNVVTMRG
jgi:integrase